jgi:hypothetical protein
MRYGSYGTYLRFSVTVKLILFDGCRGYLDFDVEMEHVGVFWSGAEVIS